MKTAVASAEEFPDNWRETMPLWAHTRWWLVRKFYPEFNSFRLTRFVSDSYGEPDYGWLIVKDAQGTEKIISVARTRTTSRIGF